VRLIIDHEESIFLDHGKSHLIFNKSHLEFGVDNVPYPSQTRYNQGKIKKAPYEFIG